MTELIPHKVFDISIPININWEYALSIAKSLPQQEPVKIPEKAVINILAEYGAIAHHCSFPPKSTNLAIVICTSFVCFCPSSNGLNGVFIEPYQEEKHGLSFASFEKLSLSNYSNINARLDAWNFYALILGHGSPKEWGDTEPVED